MLWVANMLAWLFLYLHVGVEASVIHDEAVGADMHELNSADDVMFSYPSHWACASIELRAWDFFCAIVDGHRACISAHIMYGSAHSVVMYQLCVGP